MDKASKTLSVDELISLAQQSYDELNPALAAKYYQQALEQKPDDANLWHLLGIMHVECGEAQQAHAAFLKSIQLSPTDNESNYLYIGQQCEGAAAKTAFEKGIQIMLCKLNALDRNDNDGSTTTSTTTNSSIANSTESSKKRKSLRAAISNVYVSMAELFMTDLCDEENAQTECDKYLRLALQFDDSNIEAFATFAQFKHCQANEAEAIRFFAIGIQKLFAMQFDREPDEEEEADEQKELQKAHLNDDDDDEEECKMAAVEDKLDALNEESLSIDSCLMIIRIGMELEQYEPCLILLRALLSANDEIGEIYALGALCWYKVDNKQEAAVWLHNAQILSMDEEEDNAWNDDLKAVLAAVENEMDMQTLPDISKLNLEQEQENDGQQVDIEAFLRDADLEEKQNDNDEDDSELEDDDLRDLQKHKMRVRNMTDTCNEDEDIDLNNDDADVDNDVIDVD